MALSLDTLSPLDPNNMEPVNCDGLKVNLFSDISPEISVSDEKLATFLRIRPLESLSIDESPYKVINSNLLCVDLEENASINNGNRKPSGKKRKFFNFTEIFDDSVSQKTIFSKCCLPLVNDVLNGTNALLFCFGTTSSGKSYTMRGPPDDPTSDPGLIPLSLKRIFCSRKFVDEPLIGRSKFCDINLLNQEQQDVERQFKESILASSCCRNVSAFTAIDNSSQFNEDGYQYICYLSYFEIYNGLVFDLLVPSSGGRGTALSLFPDDKQRYFVKDLKSVMVSTLTEALQIYSFGWTNLQRNIQETGLNKNSSRSHSFLCVTLIKFKEDDGRLLESQVSHLTLGDLAGSERQNKTHSEGLRVKEGGNINVSLMHLKECFNQTKLSQKNPNRNFVIPFRNSSLTKFFQPYLTGTGRVWMIVNINPSPSLLHETCGSLDLGETASHISVNSTYQLKLEESKRRVTQMWLQSSQRWSSFAGSKSKILDVPEVVIEEDADLKDSDYCTLVQPNCDLLSVKEREEQIRREVISQFEEILNDITKDHEKEIQITRDNYEKTMEARLALSDKKYQRLITEMQSKMDKLVNELWEASEKVVHLEEEIAAVRSNAEQESKLEIPDEQLTKRMIITNEQEIQTENQFVSIEEYEELKASYEEKINDIQVIANLETELEQLRQEMAQPAIVTGDQEVQTEKQLVPIEELEMLKRSKDMEIEELKVQWEEETKSKLHQLRQEFAQRLVVTEEREAQTDKNMVPIEELETLKRIKDMEIEELKVQWEEETISKLHQLRQELAQRLVDTEEREAQTELNMVPIEEIELVKKSKEMEINELKARQEKEMISKLEQLRQEMTQPIIVTGDQEVKMDQKMVPIDELKVIQDSHATELNDLKETLEKEAAEKIERYEKQLIKLKEKLAEKEKIEVIVPKAVDDQPIEDNQPENEIEMDGSDFVISPKRSRKTLESTGVRSAKKAPKDAEKNMSVKKSREITIDTNYLPASVVELTKKKRKETIASPSTEIANEYLKMFCPASATKKSVKKSAKKQPRKSTKFAVVPEPEYEKEDDVEDDEIGNLLASQKKTKKKNSKEEESALKIPAKRKRLPVNDALLETTISDCFEDEEKQESNVKGGRVLRPRRKIKF